MRPRLDPVSGVWMTGPDYDHRAGGNAPGSVARRSTQGGPAPVTAQPDRRSLASERRSTSVFRNTL